MPSSRGSSWPSDWTRIPRVSCIGKWILYHECYLGNSCNAVKSVFFFPTSPHGRHRQDFLSMLRLVSLFSLSLLLNPTVLHNSEKGELWAACIDGESLPQLSIVYSSAFLRWWVNWNWLGYVLFSYLGDFSGVAYTVIHRFISSCVPSI